MEMEAEIYNFKDILLLLFFLGGGIFIIGLSISIFFILKEKKIISNRIKVLLIFFRLCLSIVLSLFIWKFWCFKFDIMFGPIFLPGLAAECLTLYLLVVIKKILEKQNKE